MRAIDDKFNLGYTPESWADIKKIDDLITISERRELMPRLDRRAYGRGVDESIVPKIKFKCMSPPQAALAFLNQFFLLMNTHPNREQAEAITMIKEAIR